ncbi:hypothetical protein SAMN05880570_4249 [Paenibacillus sp. RU4T]|nr:hypothetical protein SAMN05880555_4247 [Paenibacillus sp. RU4X]SIR65154.1 hypothetical protein SAMN05880570_4249 [Paenibacillus sp. RU4T]
MSLFRRRRRFPVFKLLLAAAGLLMAWMLVRGISGLAEGNGSGDAREVVESFYTMEREGNFGGSWELFHSQMKEHFTKDSYIQKRAHVFMQDFGVKTFSFKLGGGKTVNGWQMSADSPALPEVYAVPVTMLYESSFGVFDLEQTVYAAKEGDEWKILWSYQGNSLKESS